MVYKCLTNEVPRDAFRDSNLQRQKRREVLQVLVILIPEGDLEHFVSKLVNNVLYCSARQIFYYIRGGEW